MARRLRQIDAGHLPPTERIEHPIVGANIEARMFDFETVRSWDRNPQAQVERALDELSQREVINTGVILAPNVRFYPVSLDRFITEILDQEFKP